MCPMSSRRRLKRFVVQSNTVTFDHIYSFWFLVYHKRRLDTHNMASELYFLSIWAYEVCTHFHVLSRDVTTEGWRTWKQQLKLVMFHLMQLHFSDILRYVAVWNSVKAPNGFLTTQRQVTLKDVIWARNVRKLQWPCMSNTFLILNWYCRYDFS